MSIKFANNASTTLSSAVGSTSATYLSVTDQTGFPVVSGGSWFIATLDDGTNLEIVKVTNNPAQNGYTVVRAQEGTTAYTFAAGTKFEVRITAATLQDFADPHIKYPEQVHHVRSHAYTGTSYQSPFAGGSSSSYGLQGAQSAPVAIYGEDAPHNDITTTIEFDAYYYGATSATSYSYKGVLGMTVQLRVYNFSGYTRPSLGNITRHSDLEYSSAYRCYYFEGDVRHKLVQNQHLETSGGSTFENINEVWYVDATDRTYIYCSSYASSYPIVSSANSTTPVAVFLNFFRSVGATSYKSFNINIMTNRIMAQGSTYHHTLFSWPLGIQNQEGMEFQIFLKKYSSANKYANFTLLGGNSSIKVKRQYYGNR